MKRINFAIIILICLLCIASQCSKENCHRKLSFVNKSSKDVYVYHSGCGNYGIPDSSFFVLILSPSYTAIKPNEIRDNIYWGWDCLEYWLAERTGPLNVFVLDAEVYKTVPRDTILKYRMVTTITPTLEDMQNSNWTITFTGE
jgi:hypothetical protein